MTAPSAPADSPLVWQPDETPEPPGLANVERVLCVFAHPDDVDFAAAGTVAALTARGVRVAYCLATDGQQGGYDPAVSRADMAAIRRREQAAAARAVGVSELTFLGHADGSLQPDLQLRRAITAVLRTVRPELVLTHNPVRNLERIHSSHPDHLACGEATLAAIYPDARNRFCYPDLGLEPWEVPRALLIGNEAPNYYVDVTTRLAQKRAALLAHASQRPGIGAGADVEGFLAAMLRPNARAAGLPDGRFAEAFRLIATS
jgi:LmbE family N-acetylglucosaminyl deacetylase